MPLPYELEKLEAVDEQFRSLYTEDKVTGRFRLGLTGMPAAPDAKEIEALKAQAALAAKYQGVTDDDLRTLEKAKAGKLLDEGKLLEYTEAKVLQAAEQYKTKIQGFETQLAEANGSIKNYEAQIRQRATQDLLDQNLTKLKYQPRNANARGMVHGLFAKAWTANEKGELEGRNTDGTPLLSKEKPGERLTIEEAIRSAVTENPFLFAGSDGKEITINNPGIAHGMDLTDPVAFGKFAKQQLAAEAK